MVDTADAGLGGSRAAPSRQACANAGACCALRWAGEKGAGVREVRLAGRLGLV